MSTVDRREFFSAALAAAGFSATASWCDRWFRPQDPQGARERQLRAAVAKAREQGKPLLVLVVPEDQSKAAKQVYLRSHWLGAFVTHGGEAAQLEIGLCVPACATLPEVRAVTGAAPIDGLPLLLVVDVAQVGTEGAPAPKVTRLDLELGELSPEGFRRDQENASEVAAKHVEKGLERLTQELRQTLQRHGATLATLAEAVRTRLDAEQLRAVEAFRAGGKAEDELVVRATAELRHAAAGMPDDQRAALLQRLGGAIERIVVKQPLAGARWYLAQGCGNEPEDPTPAEKANSSMVACGMGMVPRYCERFLGFYSAL